MPRLKDALNEVPRELDCHSYSWSEAAQINLAITEPNLASLVHYRIKVKKSLGEAVMSWIGTQVGVPHQFHSILNAEISLASELGGVETSTIQVFKHGKFEPSIKGGTHQ